MRPSELVRELTEAGGVAAATGETSPVARARPALAPVAGFTPTQPPEPANEVEAEALRYQLRAARLKVTQEEDRLAGLERARERARGETYGALEALALAEQVRTDAQRHWHRHLVVAYTGGQDILGTPSPENAQAEVDRRAEQLRSADALLAALGEEIERCEAEILGLRGARDEAAGLLVSRSPQFLGLLRDIQAAFATLRTCRVAIREIGKLVPVESRLRDLSLVEQPTGPERFVGYRIDEDVVAAWLQAVARLREDADAALPGAPGQQHDV